MAETTCPKSAIRPTLPSLALSPRLRLMACGGWCLWVMPQENAFHNLLFLLEKRRKRGEGHKQNKQERSERRREESARAEGGGDRWHKASWCWWSLCGPVFWQEGGEGYGDTRRQKMVCWCSWVYLTLLETRTGTKWSTDICRKAL